MLWFTRLFWSGPQIQMTELESYEAGQTTVKNGLGWDVLPGAV